MKTINPFLFHQWVRKAKSQNVVAIILKLHLGSFYIFPDRKMVYHCILSNLYNEVVVVVLEQEMGIGFEHILQQEKYWEYDICYLGWCYITKP